MIHPRFFGFGSLVNCATHTYPNPRPAKLSGWRRIWMPIDRDVVALSVAPAAGAVIQGLTADVPNADWEALDLRETGYQRHVADIEGETAETWVYAVPGKRQTILPNHMILQSYLDVVLQGFMIQSGEAGVRHFFETTDGWDVPVVNDREAPRYPRHQPTSAKERDLFDTMRLELVTGRQ